jgi:hypothetical protein
MREVDPEVAELLGNLPPTRLPEELTKAGWGTETMHGSMARSSSARIIKLSTEFQPVYATHCVQCGRPITDASRGMRDHAGDVLCDGAIIDDQVSEYHADATEYERARVARDSYVDRLRLDLSAEKILVQRAVDKAVRANTTCGVVKHGAHQHQCHITGIDHFGFHECAECHHLWR